MVVLKDITPPGMRCDDFSPHCEKIFETEDRNLVIIGKILKPNLEAALAEKCTLGEDEFAIEISQELVAGLTEEQRSSLLEKKDGER